MFGMELIAPGVEENRGWCGGRENKTESGCQHGPGKVRISFSFVLFTSY